ncbi:thiolase family protein [Bordetella sp. BOR01]|uniref:thiolase family protein n=1 Tax=Bordetella sp. BOR01 TaxID=2854779 RepID=UPI001C43FE38|nr:thiolase family protein [Bordetella sp. BOR01]MBV7485334.1 thiolase family protein [Bordetella sp. BOR01]
MNTPVIIDAVRSPFGKRGGVFAGLRPDALLAQVLAALVARSGVTTEAVDDVIVGCVSQAAEQGGNVARQASLLAGLPIRTPGVTLNRMCSSGQTAVHFAAQSIAAGDASYAIGAGVEHMSRVPMFIDVTLGPAFVDWSNLNPDLLEQYEMPHQGISAEFLARHWNINRSELDAYAMQSHQRASVAMAAGKNTEIVPVLLPAGEGAGSQVMHDEGIRHKLDPERIAALSPLFDPEKGVITAANSSQMTDGAAAVLIGNAERARSDGLQPKARFLARVAIGSDPKMQLDGVYASTREALRRARLTMKDIDWIEINEAFASVPLAWSREFNTSQDDFNLWGGAIAHGHPLGATGAGLIAKALAGLQATNGEIGLIVFCAGHGMSTATVIQRV